MGMIEMIKDSWDHGNMDEIVGLFILSIALVCCGFILIVAVLNTFNDYED